MDMTTTDMQDEMDHLDATLDNTVQIDLDNLQTDDSDSDEPLTDDDETTHETKTSNTIDLQTTLAKAAQDAEATYAAADDSLGHLRHAFESYEAMRSSNFESGLVELQSIAASGVLRTSIDAGRKKRPTPDVALADALVERLDV